jgi:hypothetical protein
MGFEVVYYYKELIDENNPGVYSEDVKTKTSKIGRATEDVSFEVLSSKILSQLARRNILIINFEIFEFQKKKINYKETNDGIIIKNKKYKFDGKINSFVDLKDCYTIEQDEEIYENDEQIDVFPCKIKNIQPNVNLHQSRPIRYEYFDPELMSLHKAKQKNLKFTQGKKYPILGEENLGGNLLYKTKDDSDQEVRVSAEYFTAAIASGNSKEIDLWSRYSTESEVPDIR